MTNFSLSPVTKNNLLHTFKKLPPKLVIGGGVFLFIVILWFMLLKPLQQTLELRLEKYPAQLLSIQELNQTLRMYQTKDLKTTSLSQEAITVLQKKLLSQGLKFTLVQLENTNVVKIDLKIDEIDFSRWLELLVDFRKNNGLYASDVVIKKMMASA